MYNKHCICHSSIEPHRFTRPTCTHHLSLSAVRHYNYAWCSLYSVGSVYIYHEMCNHCMLKYKLYIYMYTILYHYDPHPAPSILFDVINIDPVTCRVIQTPPALVQSQECSRIIHCFISRTWYLAFYQTSGPFICPSYSMQVQTASCIPTVEFLRFLLFVEWMWGCHTNAWFPDVTDSICL